MKVVILCGGRGLRMNELTEDIPKPLAPVCGKPMLWHIMKIYKHYGFDEFILLLGYKGDKIKEYFMDYKWKNHSFKLDTKANDIELLEESEDWNIVFLDTGIETMTGSRIKRAQKLIGNETFMFTYGDGLSDIDINKLLAYHREKGKLATVTGINKKTQYGTLKVEDGVAKSFREKQSSIGIINGGFFVFEPGVFDYLDDDTNCILEQGPLQNLASDGQLAVYMHNGFWAACDTYNDILKLNKESEGGTKLWKVWETE
ncbi:MAG: NTP transferase domain-containing protein [Clostridiaceae bacterium]|nr:NTP transferase domain-containing protein [Clostridiaceae bacterium]